MLDTKLDELWTSYRGAGWMLARVPFDQEWYQPDTLNYLRFCQSPRECCSLRSLSAAGSHKPHVGIRRDFFHEGFKVVYVHGPGNEFGRSELIDAKPDGSRFRLQRIRPDNFQVSPGAN